MARTKPTTSKATDRGAIISAAMKELSARRTKARANRHGVPAKQLIFTEWFKLCLAGKKFDAETVAKKYPDVKLSSIRSWTSGWLRGNGAGPAYPSNARGQEKQIRAAIKKALAAA